MSLPLVNQTVEITADIVKALNRAKIALMSKADTIFFTTVLFSLRFFWDEACRTAATDGRNLFVSPTFFMSLDEEERLFLLLHETLHAAFMHMGRLMGRDPKKWNIACDHYINLLLISRGFKMPKNGLADPQYADLNPDQIYKLLPDDPSSDGFGMDIQHDAANTDAIEQEMQDILVRASVHSKMGGDKPGSIPGEIEIYLNKLLNPKLPWQVITRRFIKSLTKSDYTFKKPNRRYFPDHYLPSLHGEKLVDLAIAVDASGSVSDEDFLVFVSETHGLMKMMKPDNITLIQFDSRIKEINKVSSIQELSKIKFYGRGGTSINPVLNWANENRPELLIVFTDGYFHFSELKTKVPVIWLIHNNESFKAPFGKVIHYEI